MKIAVDVCIGRDGRHLLQWAGHEVVTVARQAEDDRAWFARALRARVEVVISQDSDLEILAYDAAIDLFKPVSGESEVVTVTRFLSQYGAPALKIPVASSHEIRCCVCGAAIHLEATAEANGTVACEGCGAYLAWFIPFARDLTGGVLRVEVVQIREPGPSDAFLAELIREALDPSKRTPLARGEIAAWVKGLPGGVDDPAGDERDRTDAFGITAADSGICRGRGAS